MDERLATAYEFGREGLHGARFLVDAPLQVAPVVAEGEVDDTIGLRDAGAEAVKVGEVSAQRRPAGGREDRGRRIGADEAEDLVARGDEVGNDNRTDAAAGASDEYADGRLRKTGATPRRRMGGARVRRGGGKSVDPRVAWTWEARRPRDGRSR